MRRLGCGPRRHRARPLADGVWVRNPAQIFSGRRLGKGLCAANSEKRGLMPGHGSGIAADGVAFADMRADMDRAARGLIIGWDAMAV